MRKKLSLLLICCTITTYSQVQKEWIIGNNRINFDSAPPTVSYFNTNLFTATSIETNSTSKSIYVDYNANPYIANDFKQSTIQILRHMVLLEHMVLPSETRKKLLF